MFRQFKLQFKKLFQSKLYTDTRVIVPTGLKTYLYAELELVSYQWRLLLL